MALSVPLSRFTPRVGGGSAFFVRPLGHTTDYMRHKLFAKLLAVLFIAPHTFAQGAFQNLGFESIQNIPVFDPQGHPWTMPASDALPGWSCYLGTNQVGYAWYNDVALDSAAVGVQSSTSPYLPSGFLVGQYCLSLQYGVVGYGQYGVASITQTGQLSSSVQSIRFRGTDPFVVTFDGVTIPLVILSSQSGYNVYGGDISQFAGQSGTLAFTSYTHFGYLDAIQFSTQSVPEPSGIALFAVGFGVLCCHSWRLRR